MNEILINTSFCDTLLDPHKLAVTWELVPGRGAKTKSQEHILKMAALAAKDPNIHGITLTDSPGGKPSILTYPLATRIQELGIEPIVHFTCKDKNRNAIESELYALSRSNVQNLLVMTGDYPSEGLLGKAKPVFDLDPVHTLKLIEKINRDRKAVLHQDQAAQQTDVFFPGVVVSPFKATEAEAMSQYYKLGKKISSGAKFVISQLGYDARKLDELRRYMTLYHPDTPLIGNIYVLSLPAAKVMNRNQIPGCVVTNRLLTILEQEDSQYTSKKEGYLWRAAKLYALLKGLQYNGVNISGHGLQYADIQYIVEKGEELSLTWQNLIVEFDFPQSEGFYYFEKDESTGLNCDKPAEILSANSVRFSLRLSIFRLIHGLAFAPSSLLFPFFRSLAGMIDKTWLKVPFTYFEYLIKTLSNECHFCGDCVMHDLGFICPMSQCPKQQRNGACGGSHNGWCEVYPEEQKCIYVTMYETCKGTKRQTIIRNNYFPPCNYTLQRTSSWLNYFKFLDLQTQHAIEKGYDSKP